jgi:hypothetical protein
MEKAIIMYHLFLDTKYQLKSLTIDLKEGNLAEV